MIADLKGNINYSNHISKLSKCFAIEAGAE